MLDLDHFKQVNDQRGHAVGDQVLANVGAVMRGAMRSRDFAGRNGGEEFAILLPDTEIPAALRIAERVRAAIAEMSLPGTDVAVTVSVGVAGYPEHASTPDRLARLADAALYLAKRQGRNRVELAEPSVVVGAFDRTPARTRRRARRDPADPGPAAADLVPGPLPAETGGLPRPGRLPAETGRPQRATARAPTAATRVPAGSGPATAATRKPVASPSCGAAPRPRCARTPPGQAPGPAR